MKTRQLSFDKFKGFEDHSKRDEHGGDIRKGQRKLQRPFDRRQTVHAVMRSSKARGPHSFLNAKFEKKIYVLVKKYSERYGVKIHRYANGGNHLHFLIGAKDRKSLQNFFRVLAGMIPRSIMGAEKGRAKGKFWDAPVYTKIVHFGRHFDNTANYIFKNSLEAFGIIPPRKEARGHLKLNYEEIFDELTSR